jgi:hypothetical protein
MVHVTNLAPGSERQPWWQGSDYVGPLHSVHRLDKGTSGYGWHFSPLYFAVKARDGEPSPGMVRVIRVLPI